MQGDLFCNRVPLKIFGAYTCSSASSLQRLAHFPFLQGRDGSYRSGAVLHSRQALEGHEAPEPVRQQINREVTMSEGRI